jgi:hypothetical protein
MLKSKQVDRVVLVLILAFLPRLYAHMPPVSGRCLWGTAGGLLHRGVTDEVNYRRVNNFLLRLDKFMDNKGSFEQSFRCSFPRRPLFHGCPGEIPPPQNALNRSEIAIFGKK